MNTVEILECENKECRTHAMVSAMFVIIGELLEQHNVKTRTITSSNSFVVSLTASFVLLAGNQKLTIKKPTNVSRRKIVRKLIKKSQTYNPKS